jgi:hypothetical protein
MQDLIRYTERDFSKGYKDNVKPEMLPSGYASMILNAVVDGGIKKRYGYTMVANAIGNKYGLGLGSLEKTDGTKRLVAVWNNSDNTNSVYMSWDGSGNWTQITGASNQTANKFTNFVQATDKLYSFNGTDTCLAYNGSSASPITAMPIGKYAIWFHNFFFVAGNPTYPNRLYFSNAGNPETWAANDYIDINPNDGDFISGLYVLGDELLISKKNRVFSLTGFDVGTFSINNINERINGFGNISHNSFQNIGNDTLFLSFTGNIPHIRSIQRTRYAVNVAGGIISEDIEGTMLGLNKSKLDISTSIFDGRKYYLAVPEGSSTINNVVIVYDTVNKSFVKWTGLNVAAWAISTIGGKAEIYFQEANNDSKVYKLDSSNSDNGNPIDFQYKTRMFTTRGIMNDIKIDTKAKWKYLFITVDTGNDVNLDIKRSSNSFDFNSVASVNLKGSSSVLPFILPQPLGSPSVLRKRVELGGDPAYSVQFNFCQNEANKPVHIREYTLLFKPKKIRDA